MGMLATIMNAIYVADAFRRAGQNAKVLTPFPVGNITTLYEKDTALEMLSSGVVIINAGGLGHPLFSTDTITALRAAELEADCVLYAKNTDGVYDANPKENAAAKKFRTLSYHTAISENLNIADMTALQISQEANIPSYVFELEAADSIMLACSYPSTKNLNGTYISVQSKEDYYGL
jgi:uridylate kinase